MKFPFVSCSLLYSKLPEECQAHEEYLINIWWMYEWFLNVELFCLHYASSFYRAPNCRRRISMDSSCVLITYLKPWVYPPKGTGREDSSWISELPLDAIKIVLVDFKLADREPVLWPNSLRMGRVPQLSTPWDSLVWPYCCHPPCQCWALGLQGWTSAISNPLATTTPPWWLRKLQGGVPSLSLRAHACPYALHLQRRACLWDPKPDPLMANVVFLHSTRKKFLLLSCLWTAPFHRI